MSLVRLVTAAAALFAPLAFAEPLKLVVPDFNAIGPSKEKAQFFTEHVSGRLSEVGAQVTTQRALQQLIGIERQRQLLGCAAEQGSCMAELASALGADALLLGDIAQIESLFQINLKVVSGADGKVVATYQARVNSENALLDELDKAAFELVADTVKVIARDPPRALKTRGPSLRLLSIGPAGLGVAAAITSAVMFGLAGAAYGQIPKVDGDMPRSITEVDAIAARGKAMQTAGWVLLGLGVAGLAAGAVMFLLGAPAAPVKATVVGTGAGAALWIGGEW